jgi:hypothetical protein
MRILAALAFVTGGLLAWVGPPGTAATEDNPGGGKTTQWDGYRTWYHLTKGRPITGDPTGFTGNKDVEKGFREVYVNKTGEAVMKGEAPYAYPAGSVLVREVYSDKKGWEEKKAPALLVSIKLPMGTAPESKDWEYVLVPPGAAEQRGRGASETAQFCTKCHLSATAANDYHFTNAAFFAKQKK